MRHGSLRRLLLILNLIFALPASLLAGTEFLTSRYYPGVSRTYWAVPGDVNNDGHPDIVLVSDQYGPNALFVALGNPDGSFQTPLQVSSGGLNQGYFTLADVNADGKLDIVATYYVGNPPRVAVFLGHGDGTFGTPILTSATSRPLKITVADLNGDGHLDAVTASPEGKLGVFLGNGDGTFRAQPEISVALDLTTVTTGDFNKDGHPDVIVSGLKTSVYLLLGKGDGTFQAAQTIEHDDGGGGLLVADFNGDGNPDLASSTVYDYTHYSQVSVVLGNGDGTFQPSFFIDFYAYPQMSAADLNGDGKLDLVNSTGGVSLGNGDGTFSSLQGYVLEGTGSIYSAVADVNGDGKLDIFGAAYSGTLPVAIGLGNGGFIAARTYSGIYGGATGPVGDFNGDGIVDTAGAVGGTNMTGQVLLGNGDGSFTPGATFTTAYGTEVGVAGDLNNDGKLDLVFVEYGDVSVFLGQGDGTFPQHQEFGSLNLGTYLNLGDFNKDGKLDAAVSDSEGPAIDVFLGNGDGTLQTQVVYPVLSSPGQFAAADIDNDGKIDFVVANSGYSWDLTATLLFGNGDGTFEPAVSLNTGTTPRAAGVGDLNHDGKPDLVIVTDCPDLTLCTDQASVFLGAGNRIFVHNADYPVALGDLGYGAITLGDVNSDGKLDVVASTEGLSASLNVGVLLGNGDGTLQPVVGYTGGLRNVLADFNRDGALDIGSESAGITVLLNTAGTKITTRSTPNPSKRGQAVTFTAKVQASVISASIPTGSMTFKNGAHTMTVKLDKNGGAQFTTSSLPIGTDVITTRYSGDSNFLPKNGPSITQVVTQ